jgi:probable rRNA maturation factor
MINVQSDPSLKKLVAPHLLERAAQVTLQHQSVPQKAELTLVLSDDARLQELNRDYLGVDAPTDVLSFPADQTDPETGAPYLGDILISLPRAEQQAAEAGHPLETEVQLLAVHGILHLLGYDHTEEGEKARMWAAQAQILATLGLDKIAFHE